MFICVYIICYLVVFCNFVVCYCLGAFAGTSRHRFPPLISFNPKYLL